MWSGWSWFWFNLWCLVPLSIIFQLYRDGGGNQSTRGKPPTCTKKQVNGKECIHVTSQKRIIPWSIFSIKCKIFWDIFIPVILVSFCFLFDIYLLDSGYWTTRYTIDNCLWNMITIQKRKWKHENTFIAVNRKITVCDPFVWLVACMHFFPLIFFLFIYR
jgi:hypothetical protein